MNFNKQYLRIHKIHEQNNLKFSLRQKKEFRRRVDALRGKYKGMGLMKALMVEKEREKNH